MWDAAERFSSVACPGAPFPVLGVGAVCPYCQQTIAPDAVTRLRHFAEFVSSGAQADVRRAEATHAIALSTVIQVVVNRPDIDLATNELVADDAELGVGLRTCLEEAAHIQQEAKKAAEEGAPYPGPGLQADVERGLRSAARELRDRAASLRQQGPTLDPQAAANLRELEARSALGEGLNDVVEEIERHLRRSRFIA